MTETADITEVLFEISVTRTLVLPGRSTVRAECCCGGTWVWTPDGGPVTAGYGAKAWDDDPGPPQLQVWLALHALTCPDR